MSDTSLEGRKPRLRWPVAAGLLFFCVAGCQPSTPSEEAEPLPGQAETLSEPASQAPALPTDASWRDVALRYCTYTQGPVPYWFLVEELAPLLRAGERELARTLAGEAADAVPANEQPRMRAVNRVLQSRTRCELQAHRETEEEIAVALIQTFPNLHQPNVDLGLTGLSEQEQEARWVRALQESAEGEQERRFALRLVPDTGGWRVDAQLESRFAAPLRSQRAATQVELAVRDRHWEEASKLMQEHCDDPASRGWCEDMRGTVERGHAAAIAAKPFRDAITLSRPMITGLAVGPDRSVPVLDVHLDYNGERGIKAIWVEVVGKDGDKLVCILNAARPPARSGAIRLQSGVEAEAHCMLRGEPATPLQVDVLDIDLDDATQPTATPP